MHMLSREALIPKFTSHGVTMPPLMIDHIDMVIGDFLIHGVARDVGEFVEKIDRIDLETHDGECLEVFNTPKYSPNGSRFEAHISRKDSRLALSGALTKAFGIGRVPRHSPEFIRLGLDANLNLNHFLMSQVFPNLFRIDRPVPVKPLALAIATLANNYKSEFCLTDDWNLLIGPPSIFRYALSKSAEGHFMDYVERIENFLTQELQRIAYLRENVTVECSPYYSLRKIEFVAEFSHDDPIRFVENLVVPMRSLGRESRQHRALVRGEEVHVKQNSISIAVEIAAGCHLVVYAKTNERIRFEVRFDQEGITAALKNKGDASRTANTHDDLRQIVATLREAATVRLRWALEMLDRQRIPPTTGVTAIQLCAEVGRVLQDDGLAHTVLETLRLRGSLAPPHKNPVRAASDKLVEAGILKRAAPRSQVFVPVDRYLRSVTGLRSMDAIDATPTGLPSLAGNQKLRRLR